MVDARLTQHLTRLDKRIKYPWRTLKVGRSFPIPREVKLKTMYQMASRTGRLLGKKFACRATDDGPRVFRIN